MFSIQIFEPTGAEVTSFIEPGTGVCWFHAGSMSETLEFTNPYRYLPTVLESHEYKEVKQSASGRPSLYVREEGVYILIMRSKSPWASEFQRWLAYDVLPSIRKTGSFGGVPNSESGGSEFWALIDGARSRNLDPEETVRLHLLYRGQQNQPRQQSKAKVRSLSPAIDSSRQSRFAAFANDIQLREGNGSVELSHVWRLHQEWIADGNAPACQNIRDASILIANQFPKSRKGKHPKNRRTVIHGLEIGS